MRSIVIIFPFYYITIIVFYVLSWGLFYKLKINKRHLYYFEYVNSVIFRTKYCVFFLFFKEEASSRSFYFWLTEHKTGRSPKEMMAKTHCSLCCGPSSSQHLMCFILKIVDIYLDHNCNPQWINTWVIF